MYKQINKTNKNNNNQTNKQTNEHNRHFQPKETELNDKEETATYRDSKVVANRETKVLLLKAGHHLLALGVGVNRHLEDTVDVRNSDDNWGVSVFVVAQTSAKGVCVCCWVRGEGLCTIIHNPVHDWIISLSGMKVESVSC